MRRGRFGAAAVVSMGLVAAACGSSPSTAATTGTSAGRSTPRFVTVGLLTDQSGLAASSNKTSVLGVEAGIQSLAQRAGYAIKLYTADTQTDPSTALAAAQKLVEEDHVTAVIAISSLTFAASDYLTAQGVPVVGIAQDGPEWITAKNMFSVFGPIDFSKVTSTVGDFLKKEGATNVGTLGYGITPASADAAEDAALSAQAAGVKAGYVNANFSFGSTNVAPVVLAMKSAGVDAVVPATTTSTNFALVTALRQAGVDIKVALMADGYGGDLTQGGPTAVRDAQGMYFYLSWEPMEMDTASTRAFHAALEEVGVAGDPTFAEYAGYTSVALLLQGLERAGEQPSHTALVAALSGVSRFTAAGLFGSHTLDLGNRTSTAVGVDNCYWITRLFGGTFQLVPGADPICGQVVAGVKGP